jgi:teichuronic acid biosynthesis glycosyltransferase TuaH
MAAADVCLLPHRRTPLTESMSPLKLYEYLASGRPVVASDLPPARGIDSRVMLVAPGGDFPGAVREALRSGPASESERRRFVERNSWARRHERILDIALA